MSMPTSTLGTHRKLTEAEWAEIKALYETGKKTKTDLSAQFGISRQSIAEGLTKRGAVYGSRAKEVEEAVVNAEKDAVRKRLDDISAMKDRQRQRVELIQGLTIKNITDQMTAKKPLSDRKGDIAVLRSAMAIVAAGRDELYHIYDLHRDPAGADVIPEFIVSEYSQDEIDALNKQRLGIHPDDQLAEAAAALEDPDGDPLEGLLDETP